jgi:surface polysaccharide O-acyltransferase-like enzyme
MAGVSLAYNYFSPLTVIVSFAVFGAFQSLSLSGRNYEFIKYIVAKIAPATLGIYMVHPLVILGLRGIGFSVTGFNPIVSIPAVSFVAFILSYFVTRILSSIPLLKLAVGYSR